jgi:hypothetical protein
MTSENLRDEISDLKFKYQESILLINTLVQDVACQKLKIQQLESSKASKKFSIFYFLTITFKLKS